MRNNSPLLRRPVPLAWQVLILLMSIGVLLVLGLSLLVPLPPEIKRILDWADVAICVVFMADFFLLLYLHVDRMRYLLTWGWLDFLSSIPLIDPFRWGRISGLSDYSAFFEVCEAVQDCSKGFLLTDERQQYSRSFSLSC